MGLIVVGLNHKTAPVEIREKLAFNTEESTREALKKLIKLESVGEVVIFSTCNRVEIYIYSEKQSEIADVIKEFLAKFHQIDITDFENISMPIQIEMR